MKDYLDKKVFPVKIDAELQKAFCNASTQCVREESCAGCLYAPENLEQFKNRFNDLQK